MLIEATDGRYYRNPRLDHDAGTYYSNDEEGHVIQIPVPEKGKSKSLKAVLKILGIKADTAGRPYSGTRIHEGMLQAVVCYNVTLSGPIPVIATAASYDYIAESPAIYWSKEFLIIDILKLLKDDPVGDTSLLTFLGNNAKAKIRRQVSFLVGAKITDLNIHTYYSQLQQKYGSSKIRLRRKEECCS